MEHFTGLSVNGDNLYTMRVMLFITLLCMGYELSRPIPSRKTKQELLLAATTGEHNSRDDSWNGLPSWQKEASEKAVKRYAATQDKKWQRWNESMFERLG